MKRLLICLFCFFFLSAISTAQDFSKSEQAMLAEIDAKSEQYSDIAQQIWDWAELGYQETQSSSLLQQTLKDAGFNVKNNVAGMPTAFVAEYGTGSPIVGILAEFDALPGVSQAAVPYREERPNQANGHACGHHLFGAGSMAAAIAVKNQLAASGASGTVRLYGCPAEEGGAGKVYLVREGLFEDVDAVLHWHPSSQNSASAASSLANKSAKFRFYGNASHAAGSPWNGRSALDGVEAMNHMVNMLREHALPESRIHYVITRGGEAPNVVPAFAEVYYYVRHPQAAESGALFERVVKAAEGAALGTETRMEYEVIHGIYNLLINEPLAKKMYDNLNRLGGIKYSVEEKAFAEKIISTTKKPDAKPEEVTSIAPFMVRETGSGGSTDVGDVSWVVPTAGLRTATWAPGTSAHSWQAVACGGTSLGNKGMILAAKTLALTALSLMSDQNTLTEAQAELKQRQGKNFVYQSLLGDRQPPLDYRN